LDFERKQVYIRNSKNGKDRYSILGDKTILLIKSYINVFRPNSYLFFSKTDSTKSVSVDSIRYQFHILLEKNNLPKSIHIHTLRHCFATHLLENGTSIFHIMQLLGHSWIQTTLIYLHMQTLDKLKIISPIDLLTLAPGESADPQKQLFPISA
jgi:site-specific recombinase XerD